jgi:AMP-polyphosphate phosphotransferase
MFESAELGHAVSKASYARAVPKLRSALLDAQYDLFKVLKTLRERMEAELKR